MSYYQPLPLHITVATTTNNNGKGSRVRLIQEWHREGGVILLGYSLFRDFCMGKGAPDPLDAKEMLQQGASLVIADEGHLLKNITVSLSLGITTIYE
jgi:transcriptional regulator ATRX